MDATGDLTHSVLHKLLRMHQLGFIFVLVIPRAENIVVTHAPGVNLVGVLGEGVAIVTSCFHLSDRLAVKRCNWVGDCKVVDSSEVRLLILALF